MNWLNSAIHSCLDKSRYFIAIADEPAWRTVWNWPHRTDEQFTTALKKMENQFATHKFRIVGEILHVFGLRLFLSDKDFLKLSRADVVIQGKQYIDDLYTIAQRADLPAQNNDFSDIDFGGYGGLGMLERETDEFRELLAYLKQKESEAIESTYPERGVNLLKEMQSDPQLYFRRLCLTGSEDNLYSRIPILAAIDPDAFVSALLSQHPAHQQTILLVFKARYEHGNLERELASERQWLIAVRGKLKEKASAMSPIGKYRVLSLVTRFIEPVLG